MKASNVKGFTLIEALVTLALFAIITTSVAPSVSNFFTRNKVAAIVNNHSSALQLARHTAISQNVFVVLCPTKDMQTCDADWNQTKMIFVDENADNSLDANEEIIGSADMVKGFTIKSTQNLIRFAPVSTAQTVNTTIRICPTEDSSLHSRALVLSNVGRVRIVRDPAQIDCSA
ncbi:GspH/FimT family pseudopilin [Psychrosphaera haliotis]|uniref:Type II secretion system protein H n=1 Tax=Psychrosphaera haliotis TaxID=555083 RepID=A0A6N8F5N1_9GAMM|nr:GspH/FimT family pseudopilin [Psychrosphaera haliotis]MUH71508.1 prepilin-type N-terminal cleavage/methylation domain-containing protein [Psychrosphaera haliotis]